jgi:uncharacterized membrane protein
MRSVGLHWESLWYDEACSLDVISAPVADILTGRKFTLGNPAGYFALLRLWCLQFGFSVESARAFSALAGTLAIPATWAAARQMSSRPGVAFYSALLVALSPPMVFLSREARVYSLLSLVTMLALWSAVAVIRHRGIGGWLGLTATGSIMPHLHYSSFFFLLAVGLTILWARRETFGVTLGRLLVAGVLVGLAFLPGLDLFFHQLGLEWSNAVQALPHILYFPVYAIGGRTFIWKEDGLPLLALAELLVLGAIWFPVLWNLRHDKHYVWIALAVAGGVLLLVSAVSLLYLPMFNSRYASFVVPPLLIVVADALVGLHDRAPRLARLLPAVLGTVLAISLFRMVTELQKDDWRSLAAYVAAQGGDKTLVFYEDIGWMPLVYYRPEQECFQMLPEFSQGGASWTDAGYPEKLRRLGEFWFVLWPVYDDGYQQEVLDWLSQTFTVIDDQSFHGLRLWRLKLSGAKRPEVSAKGPSAEVPITEHD